MTAETAVPGVIAKHAVITDECRSIHGDVKAFNKAALTLLREYDSITRQRAEDQGVNYHLVLTVENPEKAPKPRGGHMASMPEPTQVISTDETIQVKDASERARRPTERMTRPRSPEPGSTQPKSPASQLAPPEGSDATVATTISPEAEARLHDAAQKGKPDNSSGGAECGL